MCDKNLVICFVRFRELNLYRRVYAFLSIWLVLLSNRVGLWCTFFNLFAFAPSFFWGCCRLFRPADLYFIERIWYTYVYSEKIRRFVPIFKIDLPYIFASPNHVARYRNGTFQVYKHCQIQFCVGFDNYAEKPQMCSSVYLHWLIKKEKLKKHD